MFHVTPHDIAHGGEAVARLDGKTYFVAGAMPGETVAGEIVKDKGNWARLALREILEPAEDRITPRCPHFSSCGGCQWQYADRSAQLEWKRRIVAGQLAHLGGLPDAEVRPTAAPGPAFGYRNRMDFRVVDGAPALHRSRSRQLVALDECSLLHPSLVEVFDRLGDLSGVSRVTLRTGIHTGERLAVVTGRIPDQVREWGVAVAATQRNGVGAIVGRPSIQEEVHGITYRISGNAFFQNNTSGAETLVSLVREAAAVEPDDVLLDGYAGGGLFAAALGPAAGHVIAVEREPQAVRDLKRNLAGVGVEASIVRAPFEASAVRIDEPWNVAVVDPPRTGLGRDGIDTVVASDPSRIVYVSCDPASLARDARMLAAAGYALEWAAPVDMFPQTFHVETVARFTLTGALG